MDTNLLYRYLFLLDDTREYTNNFYILEFVKIVLFQNTYMKMTIEQIHEAVEDLTKMEYLQEEIVTAIDMAPIGVVEKEKEYYSLSTSAFEEIAKRDKRNKISQYISEFISNHENCMLNEKQLETLIEKFIFQRFNENLQQISDILNRCVSIEGIDAQYTDEERIIINEFLNWDNNEKNRCVFTLVAKSYDYCMINSKCQKQEFDFENICFYLDSNIIFRLLGVNGRSRSSSIHNLIKKSRDIGINLVVTAFVKEECEYTIKEHIKTLIDDTKSMTTLFPPSAMSFAEEQGIDLEFYKKYYNWVGKGNKHLNYDGFKRSISNELKELYKSFKDLDGIVSYEVKDKSNFDAYYDSLIEIKKIKHSTKTDINSVMHIIDMRKAYPGKEHFLITADQKLVSWARGVFPGEKSIADFPSAWLSIILKYTGRELESDYKAFSQFIHLSIEPKIENLEEKIKTKALIMSSDIDDDIKIRMFEDLNNDYSRYEGKSAEDVVHMAYAKTKKEIEEETTVLFTDKKRKEDEATSKKHKEELDRIKEESKSALSKEFEKGFNEGVEAEKEKTRNKRINSIKKRNKRMRKVISIILIVCVVLAVLSVCALIFIHKKYNGNITEDIKRIKIAFEWIGAVSGLLDIILIILSVGKSVFNKILPIDEKLISDKLL